MRYTRLRARRAMGDLASGQRTCGGGVVDDCYYLTPTGAVRYVPAAGQRTPVPVTVTVKDSSGNVVKSSIVTPTIAYANQTGPGPGGAPAGSMVDDHTGTGPRNAIVASNGALVPITPEQRTQILAAVQAGTITGAAAADQLQAQQAPAASAFDLSRFMPVLLLGGAAVAAVMLLRRKPKPKPPAPATGG